MIRRDSCSGFAMIEVVLSTVVVGIMAVAAMNLTASVARERSVTADRTRAALLAQTLLEEILILPAEGEDEYLNNDPNVTSETNQDLTLGGAATAEQPTRDGFESMMSYDGWAATPPTDTAGDAIPGADGLTRRVSVTEVDPRNLDGGETPGTGVFRVHVEVLRGTALLGETVAFRTAAAESAER
ncbi:MAG: hypothetical protein AAGB48_10145 [Planctomycetota bacterium]